MVQEVISPAIHALQDPFSDLARKHRRNVVVASAIAIIIARTGFIPEEISALGITFKQSDQRTLLWIIASIVFYNLLGFLIHAWTDQLRSSVTSRALLLRKVTMDKKITLTKEKINQGDEITESDIIEGDPYPWQMTMPAFVLRHAFDLYLPVVISIVSIALVLTTKVK